MKKTLMILLFLLVCAAAGADKAEGEKYIVVEAALRTQMPEIALAELNKLQAKDRDALYWFHMGRTLRFLKRPLEAVEAYETGIRLSPANAGGYNGIGMAYTEAGNPEKGESFLLKATELSSMEASYYHDLGKAYLMQRHYQKARQPLSIALRLGGGKEVVNHLAIAMTLSGDEVQAKALLIEHYDLHEVYCLLAEAYELGGHIPEAVDRYQMSLRARSDYGRAKERLERLIGVR